MERSVCDEVERLAAGGYGWPAEYADENWDRSFRREIAPLLAFAPDVVAAETSLRSHLRDFRYATGKVRGGWMSQQTSNQLSDSLAALKRHCIQLDQARYAPQRRKTGEVDVYPGVRCRSGPVEVRVDAGRGRIVSDHGREVVSLRQTTYGDVTGDGFPERVVVFGCRERRNNPQEEKLASWRLPGKLSVFVIRTDGPKPVRLGQVLYGRGAWARDGLLQVRARPGDGEAMTLYRLIGDRWESTSDRPS